MNVCIKDYHIGDALKVDAQKEQKIEAKEFGLFFDEITAYSLCKDDVILGVFGYEINEDNKAYCYALFSDEIAPYLRILIRFIKIKTAEVCAKKNVASVMITVKKNFVKAQKFAKLLGFCYLHDLPKFYQDQDYQLFERNL